MIWEFSILMAHQVRHLAGSHLDCDMECLRRKHYNSLRIGLGSGLLYKYIYVNINIYIYIYYERKKGRNYIFRQACFVVGKCSCVLFSSHDIYSALLQRIEHCSTRKLTCRLPIYIYLILHIKHCTMEKSKHRLPIYVYICIYFRNGLMSPVNDNQRALISLNYTMPLSIPTVFCILFSPISQRCHFWV